MAREMLCLSINEIDTTQSKSLIIEQIMKLKEMVAENSPGTEDLTGTEEETAASAVETESDC